MTTLRVLFLCTHNSARSQMAEGLLRALAGERFDVASAGTEASRVHPLAIRAMGEVAIDLSGHTSKAIDAFLSQPWDYVITVCDNANERCPMFPGGTTRIHWSFDDPSQAAGTDEDKLKKFRRVRDEIHATLRAWLVDQEQSSPSSVKLKPV
ncbi:MAG: arsenate reductase ArsC [Candidatus Methylomirabilis oxygeniifera]|nr:MAG: arsenate reductase ArsC [Candidatus Methylomirabilis oxyfera]